MVSIRIGDFAVVFLWYPVNLGVGIRKWRYRERTSWGHGAAWFYRLKLVW